MKVIHEPPPVAHECDVPAPNHYRMGTVVECEDCGRRWVLARVGFSFKGWRRTLPTTLADLVRGHGSRRNWADVYRTQQD